MIDDVHLEQHPQNTLKKTLNAELNKIDDVCG